jgi:hypothetical protein
MAFSLIDCFLPGVTIIASRCDKDVDHANRIVLADPVFQAFRKQRVLPAICRLNEALHLILPQVARESYRENQI